MPLFRRLPKRGFKNKWRLNYAVVNVADLGCFDDGSVVDLQTLERVGLTKARHDRVKILGDGELERTLHVHAHEFSETAQQKIQQSGGTCVRVALPHRGPKQRNKMRPRPARTQS